MIRVAWCIALLTMVMAGSCGSDVDTESFSSHKADAEEISDLPLGATLEGRVQQSGDKLYFKLALEQTDTLIVELKGQYADLDLYIRQGALPTQLSYDAWSHHSDANESITLEDAAPGIYFVMIRSYLGSGPYTITAYTESSAPDSDGDGFWDTVELQYGLNPESEQYVAQADKIPWSGYWWPYTEGGTTAAAEKYDQYVEAVYGFNPGVAKWEKGRHGSPHAEYWVGHCNGWSAAAILEEEPVTSITKQNIEFSVADLKALLTEAHFADPVDLSVNASDPKTMHLTLLQWIGSKQQAIVADIKPDDETWNHPLYRYEMQVTSDAEDSRKRHYVVTITYLSDGVSPDYVGHSDFTKTYYYWLRFRNGDIAEAQWEKDSVDPRNSYPYPDFFWHPSRQSVAPTNPLDYEIIKEILSL